MKILKQIALVFFATVSVQSLAINFEANIQTGIDSNPLELSDELAFEQQEFSLASFKSVDSLAGWFYWDLKAAKALYFNDPRADWFQSDISLWVENDFSIYQVPFDYKIALRDFNRDETYVSRETGLIATYQGDSIFDRFDRQINEYSLKLSYPFNADTDFYFEYAQQTADYQDYDFAGLDNLDNQQVRTSLGVEFLPRAEGKFYFQFDLISRKYDSRQDRDFLSNQIADTQLVFNDYSSYLGYQYVIQTKTLWDFSFRYTNRTTNGTQYYDSQRGEINILGKIHLSDFQTLTTQLNYQTFFYDETAERPVGYFEQGDFERKGGMLSLEYNMVFATLFVSELSFYAKLDYRKFASSNDFYAFNSHNFAIGIRWAIE